MKLCIDEIPKGVDQLHSCLLRLLYLAAEKRADLLHVFPRSRSRSRIIYEDTRVQPFPLST
jgi:hypothetical protein